MERRRKAAPAGVRRLRVRIERWRERRAGREPMPAELWAAAADLAGAHGVGSVARALGLDYGSLKRRVVGGSGAGGADSGGRAGFVEMDPSRLSSVLEPGGPVVEVWDGDGTRLVIRLGFREQLDVRALLDAFRRGGW